MRGRLGQRHGLALTRGAVLDLDHALGKALLAHHDLVGPADQVGIGELHARTLVAVVEDDLDAGLGELAPQRLGDLEDLTVGSERQDRDLGGRDAHGPRDAVLVVVLLDHGGKRARDAHAVAAHDEGVLLARLVGERGAHGLRVLGAELEDLRDLDAAGGLERAPQRGQPSPGSAVTRSAHTPTAKSRPGMPPMRW